MGEFRFVGEAALKAKAMRALTRATAKAAHDLEGRAKAAVGDHVVTGNLKASIHVDGPHAAGAMNGVVAHVKTGGESSAYAVFVHEGTRPHEIPNAFGWGITVEHPGTAAVKFLEKPLIEMKPVYLAAITAAMRGEF